MSLSYGQICTIFFTHTVSTIWLHAQFSVGHVLMVSNEDKAESQAVWKVLIGSNHYVFNQYILLETACDFMLGDSDMLRQ